MEVPLDQNKPPRRARARPHNLRILRRFGGTSFPEMYVHFWSSSRTTSTASGISFEDLLARRCPLLSNASDFRPW